MTEGCVHHWVIAPPNGAASMGRCRHCEAERLFLNHRDPEQQPPRGAALKKTVDERAERFAMLDHRGADDGNAPETPMASEGSIPCRPRGDHPAPPMQGG